MAYNTQKLHDQALSAIEKDELCFIQDVIASLPCCKQTFYDHEIDKSDAIKKALDRNRTSEKRYLRTKWRKSDNATLQVAYYKLLADQEEFSRLSRSEIDHTSKDKPINIAPIQWVDGSSEDQQ